ncbi:hypothetical protein ACB092_08G086900 [Castanea dentata]
MEPLPTGYPIGDSVTMASHFLYGLPFPFVYTSTHPNHGCTLCSDCLIAGGLVFDHVMEVWDPPDNVNLSMCSARVIGRCTVKSLLSLEWKDLERLQFFIRSYDGRKVRSRISHIGVI